MKFMALTNLYTRETVLVPIDGIKSINVGDGGNGCCIRYRPSGYEIVTEPLSRVRELLVAFGAEIQ